MYYRPVNLSSEFRNAVEKLSNGRMELMFVPAGATGRYQVHDTHLHKPLKDYARKLASLWYAARMKVLNQMRSKETSSISAEDYQSRVSKLMSVVILRNKAPEWLWFSVERRHICLDNVRKCVRMVRNCRELLLSLFSCRNLSQL